MKTNKNTIQNKREKRKKNKYKNKRKIKALTVGETIAWRVHIILCPGCFQIRICETNARKDDSRREETLEKEYIREWFLKNMF